MQEIELINKALSGNLVIPDFVSFTKQIEICYRKCEVLPGDCNHNNHSTVTVKILLSSFNLFVLVFLLVRFVASFVNLGF